MHREESQPDSGGTLAGRGSVQNKIVELVTPSRFMPLDSGGVAV